MRKITLNIPDDLDREMALWLVYSHLEPRDKSRMILYAIKQLVAIETIPDELQTICRNAKETIREKQKARWQERKP